MIPYREPPPDYDPPGCQYPNVEEPCKGTGEFPAYCRYCGTEYMFCVKHRGYPIYRCEECDDSDE